MAKFDYNTQEGILKHPAFLDLPARQQQWFTELVANGGDKIAATHKVYPSTTREHPHHDYTAERITKLMRVPAMRLLVSLYFSEAAPHLVMSREELALHLSLHMRDSGIAPELFYKYAQLLMMLKGWTMQRSLLHNTSNPVRAVRKSLDEKIERANEEPDDSEDEPLNMGVLIATLEKHLKQQ